MKFDKTTELYETINDIIEDVILVEAMTLRMEQRHAYMVNASPEIMAQTFHRVMCYLSQHAADLHILTRRVSLCERGVGTPPPTQDSALR